MKKLFSTKSITGLLIPLCFISIFLFQSSRLSFIQDDTYISIRYAENFAAGNGLVFNLEEKTEGFTSFLWVLILSLSIKINLNPEQFSVAVSTLSGVLVILFSYILCRLLITKFFIKEEDKKKFPLFDFIPLLVFPLFTFNSAFIYWAVSGMEETLFMFLLLITFFFFIKQIELNRFNYPFIFFGILTCLTRPEGFLLIPFMVLIKIILLKKRKQQVLNRYIIFETALLLLAASSLVVFRLIYYGYPLPNTFYAKSGFTAFHFKRGFDYLFSFLHTNILFGSLIIVPLIISILKKEKMLFTIIISSVFFCLAIAVIGGDVLPLHRLFFPVLPFIYISCILSFVLLLKSGFNRKAAATFFLFLITAACYNSYANEIDTAIEKRGYEKGLVAKMKTYAEWIKEKQAETGRKATVAISTIGAFSYFSGATVIDLAGLTDKYIAHFSKETPGITDSLPVLWKERTYNAEYVLNARPDYIIFPAGAKPSAFPECALFVQPEFFNNYYTQLIYSDELKMYLPLFARRSKALENSSSIDCDNSFVANYITATNLFLRLNNFNKEEVIKKIENELREMSAKCPGRNSDVFALLGFANYHVRQYDTAEVLLKDCLKNDSLNSPALLYLRNISLIKKDTLSSLKYLIKLKRISPGALPNLIN